MIMDNSEYLMEDMARQGSNGVKLELNDSPLNFATSVEDYEMHGPPTKKPKTPRDPMSHRIIEKRRRDRMNNCLADLSRLIPANYMKQGQGRIEKTEIIEMAIRHIKYLQNIHRSLVNQGQCCAEKFYLGFKECEAETIRYFVECEGLDNKDQFFMRVISHLEAVSKKHLATGTQNCTDFAKEESSSGDKTNVSCSSLNDECENNKLKSNERMPQTVPEILASSHDSINSAASKQLRSLLSQGNSCFEQPDSGNASCGDSLGMFSSSESCNSGNNVDEANMNMSNGEGDLHYHGNVSSENGSSSGSSKENKFTNYKFKHDITKRFSEEEKYSVDLTASLTQENIIEYQENHNFEKLGYEKHGKDKHGYDKHSHDKHGHDKHSHDKHSHDKHSHDKHSHDKHSHEKHGYDKHSHEKHGYDKHGFEKHEKVSSKLKRKIMRSTSPSSCSDSTAYPTSEHSSNGASNNGPTILCHSPEDEAVNNGVHLPAFVLHPQGTHYLPLTIQQSCFQNSLQQLERTQQPIVFHPISILVNFATPGLVIQNAESFVNNSALDVTFSSSSSSSSSSTFASAAAAATTAAASTLAENSNSNNGHNTTIINNNNNNNNNSCSNSVINKSSLSLNCTTLTSPYNLSPVNTSSHSVGSSNSSTSSSGSSSNNVTAVNNNNNNTNTIPLTAIQANNHMSPVKHGNNTDHLNSGPVVVNSTTSLPQSSSPPIATPTVTTATALLQTPTGALITPGIVGTSILHPHPQQQQQQQHQQQQQQQQQQPALPPQHLPIHQTHLPHIHPHQPPVLPPHPLHHLPSPNTNSSPLIHMERDNRNNIESSIPIVIPTSNCYQSL